jgi:PilZ domain
VSAEKRKANRTPLTIPVRVQGFNKDGTTWEEFSVTGDVAPGGTGFTLTRRVLLGQVLYLTLPLPKRLRQFDLSDATYRVYTLVRRLTRLEGSLRVGVMFFGKYPPRGFHETPSARFLFPGDDPETGTPKATGAAPSGPLTQAERAERRAHPRHSVFVNLVIQQIDEWGTVLHEELTVADNLSRGGAQVRSTLELPPASEVVVQEAGGSFSTRAEVRHARRGPDGVMRVHLRFLDHPAPDRLIGS